MSVHTGNGYTCFDVAVQEKVSGFKYCKVSFHGTYNEQFSVFYDPKGPAKTQFKKLKNVDAKQTLGGFLYQSELYKLKISLTIKLLEVDEVLLFDKWL